eukprot:6709564-Prymnesium_polylepis.1
MIALRLGRIPRGPFRTHCTTVGTHTHWVALSIMRPNRSMQIRNVHMGVCVPMPAARTSDLAGRRRNGEMADGGERSKFRCKTLTGTNVTSCS